ncbi:hypothetical protein TNCV_400791 [Trichonephila clavipes]|nr:hypothetical protein TNCV_400791 [Trichonephila clavipes]
MVSFLDVTGIKQCPDLSLNQNALRIASGTEPNLIRKEDTTPLISCPVFMLSAPLRQSTMNHDTCRPVAVQSCRAIVLADCCRSLLACMMIYQSFPTVVVLGRPPPTFLTAVPELRLIECSQMPMVRPLLVKESTERGFNASRTVILMSKTSMVFGGTSSA